MKTTTSLVSLFFLVIACQKNNSIEKDQIKKTDWLIGNWYQNTATGTITENWQKVNDSTYKATSFFIKEKDTIHKESIILQQKEETLIYTTTIQGQNNNKPVNFEINENIENKLVFENLKNNYPQKISYKKTTSGLIIELSGIQLKKNSIEKYILVKQNK